MEAKMQNKVNHVLVIIAKKQGLQNWILIHFVLILQTMTIEKGSDAHHV